MSSIKLHELCTKKCKKGKCTVCSKCKHPSCPRLDWKCRCGKNATDEASGDILIQNILPGRRSNQWKGHITPGVDVPTVPLTSLDFRKQDRNSMKIIDRTIPNLIDDSLIDAADVTKVNLLFGIVNDNLPGKIRRAKSSVKDFTDEEVGRMSNYAHNTLEAVCKNILPSDHETLHKCIAKGRENEWTSIANGWIQIAKELPNCTEKSAILALICHEVSRVDISSISKRMFALHRRNAEILIKGHPLPTRASQYTRYKPELIITAVKFILNPANVAVLFLRYC
jgi:hypothetical protein